MATDGVAFSLRTKAVLGDPARRIFLGYEASMSGVHAPAKWAGTFVSTLDALEFLRRHDEQGRTLLIFFGWEDVRRFRSFVDGIRAHLFLCGAPDPGFLEFLTWMRIRHELSSGTWEEKFLADAGGDHMAAIRRYLREVAEFRSCAGSTS